MRGLKICLTGSLLSLLVVTTLWLSQPSGSLLTSHAVPQGEIALGAKKSDVAETRSSARAAMALYIAQTALKRNDFSSAQQAVGNIPPSEERADVVEPLLRSLKSRLESGSGPKMSIVHLNGFHNLVVEISPGMGRARCLTMLADIRGLCDDDEAVPTQKDLLQSAVNEAKSLPGPSFIESWRAPIIGFLATATGGVGTYFCGTVLAELARVVVVTRRNKEPPRIILPPD